MTCIYTTEVKIVSLPLKEIFEKYYEPERFLSYCKECPSYGKVWSCPPGVPETQEYLKGYDTMHVIAVKVVYNQEAIERSKSLSPSELKEQMDSSYGKVKAAIRETLLAAKNLCVPSIAVAAGECKICDKCTRTENKPCRFPERLLYSFSALGFNLSEISTEVLNIPILWEREGLPDYVLALAALIT